MCCRSGDVLLLAFFSDPGSRNTGATFHPPFPPPHQPEKNKCFCLFGLHFTEVLFLRSSKNHDFLFFQVRCTEGPFPRSSQKKHVFLFFLVGPRWRSLSRKSRRNRFVHFWCVFKPRSFFLKLPGLASALFRVTQVISRSSSILRVWLGTKKCRCRVWFSHFSVCECEIV